MRERHGTLLVPNLDMHHHHPCYCEDKTPSTKNRGSAVLGHFPCGTIDVQDGGGTWPSGYGSHGTR